MGQRRAASDSYRFDLVPDDGQEGDAPGPGAGPEGPTVLDRVRAWPRRRVVAGLAAAVVVLGASGVASTLIERERVAALRSAPGGVLDLSVPPRESWSVDVENGSPLTVLGGLLVVSSYTYGNGPRHDGAQLRGIDLTDGSEVWRRSYEGEWDCGPTPYFAAASLALSASESVVCVQNGPEGSVHVIDAAGEVAAERRVDGEDRQMPAGHGGVVRLSSVGEPGPLPEILGDEESGYRLDGPVIAPDLRVTMEDAATGAVRWETTVESVPTGPDNWYQCMVWSDDGSGEPTLQPSVANAFHWADESLVVVGACGVDAAFTPAGVRLDVTSDADTIDPADGASSYEPVLRTVDGPYLRPAQVDRHGQYSSSPYAPWEVVDADGTVLAALPGRGSEPRATDGSNAGIVFAQVPGGLVAIRTDDGETAWEARMDGPAGVLVRTEDVVVAVTTGQELVALDLGSGARRWTAPLGNDQSRTFGDATDLVRAAFTDGRLAVVGTPGLGLPGALTWTAFDLRTGEVAWTRGREREADGYGFAVDGRMLYWNYQTIVGLE